MRKLILAIIASIVILGPGPADAAARVQKYVFHKTFLANAYPDGLPIRGFRTGGIAGGNEVGLYLFCEEERVGSKIKAYANVLLTGGELAELTLGRPKHSAEFVGGTRGVWTWHIIPIASDHWITAETGTVKVVAPEFTARLDAVAMLQYQNGVNTCTLSGTVEVIRPR